MITTATDAVIARMSVWQNRPPQPTYLVVFFDALRVKIPKTDWYARKRSTSPSSGATLHRKPLRPRVQKLTVPSDLAAQPAKADSGMPVAWQPTQ